MVRSIFAAAALGAASFSAPAEAFFNGAYVGGAYLFPDHSEVYQAFNPTPSTPLSLIQGNLAGSGQDLLLTDTSIFVDYSAASASFWTPAAFNGFYITDVYGKIPAFTVSNVKLTTNLADSLGNPFDISNLTIEPDRIDVNWQGMAFDSASTFRLDFGPAVPEPATWAMMIAGFAAIGLTLRRRRNTAPALT